MPLKVSQGMGAWIDDFKKSDAPQFKGKSDKERRDMAIAAYLSAKRGESVDEAVSRAQQAAIAIAKKEKGKKESVEEARAPRIKYALIGSKDMKIYSTGSDERDLKLDRRSLEKRFNQPLKIALLKTAQKIGDKVDKSQIKENIEEKTSRDDLAKAMAAFKAKGGKVTKAPAAKAQGYHGKDDPGADMHGMMDKGDTKRLPRKKVGSMGSTLQKNSTNEAKRTVSIDRPDRLASVRVIKPKDPKTFNRDKNYPPHLQGDSIAKARAAFKKMKRATNEAKQTHVFDNEKDARAKAKEIGGKYVKGVGKSAGKHAAIKEGTEKPPFDNPRPIQKNPKDRFGNPIKNRARSAARQAAKNMIDKLRNDKAKKESAIDERNKENALKRKNMDASRGSRFKNQNPNMTPPADSKHKTPRDHNKAIGRALRTMGEANMNELSYKTLGSYADKAAKSNDRATNSAVATILRKGDHSKDLNTMRKRRAGVKLYKSRVTDKLRKDQAARTAKYTPKSEGKYYVGAPESAILDKVQKLIANTKNAPEAYKLVANKMKITDEMAKKLVNKVIDRSTGK